jgi:hypothetical protein
MSGRDMSNGWPPVPGPFPQYPDPPKPKGERMSAETRHVYEAISLVSADLAQTGISKDRKNQQQGYAFRGIDDVYNALAPILAKHKLVIVPRFLSRECVEREFDFVSAVDGSKHTARTFGEAMDSGDKATNKAMSAAYKYAAFQAFCIPTEGDNDADATTPEPLTELPEPAPWYEHAEPVPRPTPKREAGIDEGIDSRDGVIVTACKEDGKGKNAKGAWTRYAVTFSDGRTAKTFSATVAKAAQDAKHSRVLLRPVIEDDKFGGKLLKLHEYA